MSGKSKNGNTSTQKSFKLTVTQEHINKGRKSCELCPIAQAFKDKFPYVHVAVLSQYAFIGDSEYYLSRRAQTFIRRFDSEKIVSPATFILRATGI